MTPPVKDKRSVLAAALAAVLALVCFTGGAMAGPGPKGEPGSAARDNNVPGELEGIGIKDHSGKDVPRDVTLTDQDGKQVRLGDYFDGKRPVLLALAYYECPMLCSLVLTGVLEGVKPLRWTAGEDYRVLVVSFDPRDTPQRAADKRKAYMDAYGRKLGPRGWDFLVGDAAAVKRVAESVGFGYRWDERQQQYAHAAGAFVLTPEGRISRTLYGLSFVTDLRLSLLEASEGKIGTVMERVLLFCYHYDPVSRGYILATMRVVKLSGVLTILVLGAFLLRFWRAERRRSKDGDGPPGNALPATGPGAFIPERRS